jgi:hypothetical protein
MIPLVAFILLHTVSGGEVYVNPDDVTVLRPAEKGDPGDQLFTERVTCVVGTLDGKYVTVVESCGDILIMLEKVK